MSSLQVSFLINGVGAMGRGLAHQIVKTLNTRLAGLSDIVLGHAEACCEWLGLNCQSQPGGSSADARGVFVAANGMALAEHGDGDVFFEASSAIGDVAPVVLRAIEAGKHIVMMNAEADFAFAPLFVREAKARGVLYSSTDGDQYGVLKHLADEVSGWGLDLVMFGNIKGFLDRDANPTTIIPEADKRNLSYEMCTAYTDGTKLNIEMALIANACGGRPLQAGMRGPQAKHINEMFDLFDFDALWDRATPLIDYVVGAEPAGGVFLVGHTDDPYRRDMLRYYKMGEGPFYLFYRPCHLCHFEAVPTALRMLRDERPLMQAVRPETEVITYAKVPLEPGNVLDGIGGYLSYGLVEAQPVSGGLPICISAGAVVARRIATGERLTLDDVTFPDEGERALYEKAQAIAHGRA